MFEMECLKKLDSQKCPYIQESLNKKSLSLLNQRQFMFRIQSWKVIYSTFYLVFNLSNKKFLIRNSIIFFFAINIQHQIF